MKLKKEIIERIRNNGEAKDALRLALRKHDPQLISRIVRMNREDGPLMNLRALIALQEVLRIEDINDMIEKTS